MVNDQILLDQFSLYNKSDIKNGLSPSVPASEQVGGRKKLEIHHTQPISEGGAVYDMDNLRIVTPKHIFKSTRAKEEPYDQLEEQI